MLLNKVDFWAQLIANLNTNRDALYLAYLTAQGKSAPADAEPVNDFEQLNKSFDTDDFVPAESGQTMDQINQKIAELEADAGYERLALSVGGAVIKIAVAAAVAGA